MHVHVVGVFDIFLMFYNAFSYEMIYPWRTLHIYIDWSPIMHHSINGSNWTCCRKVAGLRPSCFDGRRGIISVELSPHDTLIFLFRHS